ncbi:hypothetical protein L249_5039 [Ophiocordyceps polyrhachis-furcata BCC 54312]|uniref:Tethering factor for nuclear proteasome STS1 n=1 Tax=Ophiocordyceps polyrhachis-furcata BCC 54312 TaxID=1330021 RepID=A0A367L3K0_9HYPO|nr:hypothetical protein L249_5039 [Ophiocordyceps polyrhachis-furcata BCC 54312]
MMNVLLSPQPPVFPHQRENYRLSPQRSVSPLHGMAPRKRKADADGDETMSPLSSPAASTRSLARPMKKSRTNDIVGRPLALPRLLETLDATQLRAALVRICDQHPQIGHEVTAGAPRPSAPSVLDVLQDYLDNLKAAFPYGQSSPDYTYYRIKESMVAFTDALSDFTPQFLPPTESQPMKSLQYLDGATKLVHELPDWESQAYRHHKDSAYEELSKAWALVINEAGKRGGGINLHSGGWDQTLSRHNEQSGGRLGLAMSAMGSNVGWMASNVQQPSILNQLISGSSGDQHQSWANPFEEPKPRVSLWTAREIATMASKLDKQLGPEYISSRSGPGGSLVHYLSAEKCIGLANEVFGFNGWSSSIQNIQVDFADENPQTQRVSIGLSVIVRVTLRDGTYHEDIGYGSIENARGKAMAFEKAKKEGTTDGLKRALRSFGNVLGNCVYDKDYVKQVTKVKAQPVKRFDQDNLHRHADFATTRQEPSIKSEAAGPTLPPPPPPPPPPPQQQQQQQGQPKTEMLKAESFEDFLGDCAAWACGGEATRSRGGGIGNGRPTPQTPTSAEGHPKRVTQQQQVPRPAPPAAHPYAPLPPCPPQAETVAFFSARSVRANSESSTGKQLFNPKAESPSIRKTAGIDHSSSRPVGRNGQHVEPAPAASQSAGTTTPGRPTAGVARGPLGNVVNPSLDQARRIGAPGGGGSPLANRSSYKPPSMKRPLAVAPEGRSPLGDVVANVAAVTAEGGVKRSGPRLEGIGRGDVDVELMNQLLLLVKMVRRRRRVGAVAVVAEQLEA